MESEIPWRERLRPARWMDTHTVELVGGSSPDLAELEQMLRRRGEDGLAWPVRGLFWLRTLLGKLFGWDGEKKRSQPGPWSYFWKMSQADKDTCLRPPGTKEGPAVVLWNDPHRLVLEIYNATCHGFAVAWVEDHRAHLAVLVIETKWWSRYYLALIEPFRKYIAYPGMIRWVESSWREYQTFIRTS